MTNRKIIKISRGSGLYLRNKDLFHLKCKTGEEIKLHYHEDGYIVLEKADKSQLLTDEELNKIIDSLNL